MKAHAVADAFPPPTASRRRRSSRRRCAWWTEKKVKRVVRGSPAEIQGPPVCMRRSRATIGQVGAVVMAVMTPFRCQVGGTTAPGSSQVVAAPRGLGGFFSAVSD